MSNKIPVDWVEETLGTFISNSMAGEWGNEAVGDKNDIPILRATNFSESGAIDYTKLAFRNVDEKKIQQKLLQRGDIVLEKSGGSPTQPVGRVIYFNSTKPFLYSNFTQKLIPSEKCDSKYLFYKFYFEYQNKTVLKFQQQTTGIINFQLKEYLLYKTTFPPLYEQQKIAKILTSVDEVIEKTHAQIDKLKDLKTGMMQELLTNGIGHTEFKDSSVGRIPADWEVVTFSYVLKKIDSGWSPSCTEVPPAIGKWGVLKVSSVTRGEFLEIQSKELPPLLEPKHHIQVNKGDILLTRANGVADLVGKCVMVREEPKRKLMMSDKLLRLIPNENIDSEFLLHSFNSERNRKQIELSWGGSSGQKNISQVDIKSYKLALPTLKEQKSISKNITNIERSIFIKNKKMDSLKNLKKALMQDLLTGKVRVKVDSE
ncbi:hypothetical protein CXF76_17800 [Pseudoalteromonas sp. 78C3]|uniref:restriction endonuclease subunit S n=1 Tax=Pseudoalteromonas sp. 78C3 TaxID=2058300 RepID=UPI000C348F35|nr:restriction endonuclease subunit S [Pseudoalteromonas sp. 78C3]PKH90152.1 hypothetical protein CXF76_17800 [Pseudoalteromonas sp. 78C3]